MFIIVYLPKGHDAAEVPNCAVSGAEAGQPDLMAVFGGSSDGSLSELLRF